MSNTYLVSYKQTMVLVTHKIRFWMNQFATTKQNLQSESKITVMDKIRQWRFQRGAKAFFFKKEGII